MAGRAECGLGSLPVTPSLVHGHPDGEVVVLIRPEQVVLSDDPTLPQARVEGVDFFGPYSVVGLRHGTSLLRARGPAGPDRAVGDQVGVSVVGRVSVYPR